MTKKLQILALKLFDKVVTDGGRQKMEISDVYSESYPIIIREFESMSPECYSIANEAIKQERKFSLNKTVYADWKQSGTAIGYYSQFLSYIQQYAGEETHTPESNCARFGQCELISSMSFFEFSKQLKEVLYSGIALDSELVNLILDIAIEENIEIEIKKVQNKEFLYSYSYETGNIILDGDFLLRVIGYISTDMTSFVKNNILVSQVSQRADASKIFLDKVFTRFGKEKTLIELSKVFNRNKRIFLALKSEDALIPIINRISKLSKNNHIPKKTSEYLTIIEKIKSEDISVEQLINILKDMDINYLTKLYNGLTHRVETNVRIFHIRNGKYFCKTETFSEEILRTFRLTSLLIKKIITDKVEQNLKDMNLSISEGVIDIAVPTSQKNFIGKIPYGSRVKIPEIATIGIYWENTTKRVDLDLSAVNEFEKIGWNTSHSNSDVLYSGDVVDGENGATESLLFENTKSPYTVRVNNFTGGKNEFKLWISDTKVQLGENIPCSDSSIISSSSLDVDQEQILGLVCNNQFTFCKLSEVSRNSSISGLSKKDLLDASIAESKSVLTFGDLDLFENTKKSVDINSLSMKQILDLVK